MASPCGLSVIEELSLTAGWVSVPQPQLLKATVAPARRPRLPWALRSQ